MNKRQFAILYRHFLFRVADLESLSASAKGDATRLLGQFAALLIFVSVVVSFPAVIPRPGADRVPVAVSFISTMIGQHFLIAATMLAVGLLAVVSWDSAFPDRRDIFVLGSLPVTERTIVLAKLAAVATSLAITVGLLHAVAGLVWPASYATGGKLVELPSLRFSPTPAPMDSRNLRTDLDHALEQALTTGTLRPGTGAGLSIGILQHGHRQVIAYGTAKPDSLFEIGSITKTFTALLLARLAAEGRVRYDEPVRLLLPPETVAQPQGGEITLADLATHRSGLPRMPSNFHPADLSNPYADYDTAKLYAYVRTDGVAKPDNSSYRYSNLGFGLLGQALADRAGVRYEDLLRTEITAPLGMNDTAIELTGDRRARFLPGHDEEHLPVHEWNLDALAGAGGIRSTAPDMLRYLDAMLHPNRYPALAQALIATSQIRHATRADAQIALAWSFSPTDGAYRHSGATGGFSSYAFFHPACDCAAIVLMNGSPSTVLPPELIGEHIRQRWMGEPATALESVTIPAATGPIAFLRAYAAYWVSMFGAGYFVYALLVTIQCILSQVLPRGFYLQASGYLQTLAFFLAVAFFFLQPGMGGLDDLTADATGRLIRALPSYWFLGLYQQLNGTLHPALEPLALSAWLALAGVTVGVASALALSYARSLRRIVEEPDLPLAARPWRKLPRFGAGPESAISQFAVRTLLRGKQHRLMLAFYLGVGLAFAGLLLKDPATNRALADTASANPWRDASIALWASSVILMALAVAGTRATFAKPAELGSNWIFRITGPHPVASTVAATRRALTRLAALPVWLIWTIVCLILWPSWQSLCHAITLGILGLILVELCLLGFRKIPFACSYLPGKSRIHLVFLAAVGLLVGSIRGVLLERDAYSAPGTTALWLTVWAAVWAGLRLFTRFGPQPDGETRFEEEDQPAAQSLGLSAN